MTTPTGPMYNSPHFKERVAASELKLKLSVSEIVKDLEDNHLRDFEKERFTCQLRCYEIMKKANAKNLTECVRNCNIDYDRGETIANQELDLSTKRLEYHMNDCQKQAQDIIPKGFEYDPRKIHKSEVVFLNCLQNIGDEHLAYLGSMRKRIVEDLRKIMPPNKKY